MLDRVTRGETGAPRTTRGLLSKASSLRIQSFGEEEAFETAFIQSVNRLPASDSTPFTVLSLLKVFHPFSAALYLTLQGNNFECATAIGVESAAAGIPVSVLFPPSKLGPHRIGSAGDFGIASASAETAAWVFPVAPSTPPYTAALVLVEEPGKPLDGASIARALVACASRFTSIQTRSAPAVSVIKDFLASALHEAPGLHLIVLEREGAKDLANQASAAVAALGSAIALGDGRALIAVPTGHDRELLAHRLAKSLQAIATAGTEVSSLDDAQEFLKAHS